MRKRITKRSGLVRGARLPALEQQPGDKAVENCIGNTAYQGFVLEMLLGFIGHIGASGVPQIKIEVILW